MGARALSRLRLVAAAAAAAALATPGGAQATVPTGNLVQNPGADEAAGETDSTGLAIPHWSTAGRLSAVQYGAGAFPTTAVRDSIGGGANFFSGGIDDTTSLGEQFVDLSAAQPEIDAGRVSVVLSAYLGGSLTDGDSATVTAKFEDEHSDVVFGTLQIGPVTAGNRGNQTTLLPRSASANVPPGTAHIRLTITATRANGQHNNGYADNLSVTLELDAKGDSATVAEDAPAAPVDVLANDNDSNGVPRKVASVTQPANGTVAITGGGTGLTYAPNANYCNSQADGAPDTFTYTLNSGGTAVVAMTVTCVDDLPVAVNDAASVAAGSSPEAIDVLANDPDGDGGLKQVASVTQPANGTVAITGGGSGLTYAPAAGYCDAAAPDTFTYTLNGGSTAAVAVTVTCLTPQEPARVTITTKPKRDRRKPYVFTTRGRVVPPASFCALGPQPCVEPSVATVCTGVVNVRFTKGTDTVSSKNVRLRSDCTYLSKVSSGSGSRRIRRRFRSGLLKVQALFKGNTVMLEKLSVKRSVRAG